MTTLVSEEEKKMFSKMKTTTISESHLFALSADWAEKEKFFVTYAPPCCDFTFLAQEVGWAQRIPPPST